ncbi:MAG: SCP2 sterol-binding domain-containing protein [Cyanobacteria bacterium SZAS TMP-1]|nr:SCP2 sterol-binding domain-containing protein [Cyanobacteria bacterium SZAS TMP-1]
MVPSVVDSEWLRQTCLDLGADDVGFVDLDAGELGAEREKVLETFPRTKSLVSIVCRMNRDNVRNPARSLANNEFHHAGEEVNHISRKLVAALEAKGIRAVNVTMGFPMEIHKFPDSRVWVVAHKTVAVAAGMGRIGIHRNVIHPKFGNFILLGTVLLEPALTEYSKPLDYNPCLDCKLCVAACPVGAISPDGHFNFSACFTHNYREFMGGFQDWTESIVESKNADGFLKKVPPGDNASMWQSLSFGAQYKAAYCMAVCPAGEDVIGQFLESRKDYLKEVVKPLQDKVETVYVTAGSDAEEFVARRFPHKTVRLVGSGLRAHTIDGFLYGLPIIFQPGRAADLKAVYQFRFTGPEAVEATVSIKQRRVFVERELKGKPDLFITAQSSAWIRFLKDRSYLPWALMTGGIKLHGDPRLLIKFGRCFVN